MDVIEAIRTRISARAFLDQPVARETIEGLLEVARWAPSGGNLQPWHVVAVTGETQRRIGDRIIAAHEAGIEARSEHTNYPREWFEPYKSRRRATGFALYGAMGIARDDTQRRKEAWYRNFRFFDAPVGLMFFVDRRLGRGSWTDMGMFLQNLMLAAMAEGLATCAQASVADYPDIVREATGMPADFDLICGMSLGYPDTAAAVNNYRTERAGVAEFTTWCE